MLNLWGLPCDNKHFLVISIVIDSDRGHCYEHLKKNQFTMKIEPCSKRHVDMYLNVCVCDEFLKCQKWQKIKFWTFQAQPA